MERGSALRTSSWPRPGVYVLPHSHGPCGLSLSAPSAGPGAGLSKTMSNLPGLGRFELVRKIAAGGMAEIFLARQWGAGGFFRDVVIKRLFRHLAEHPQQLRMFQDEGRL